MKCVTLAMLNLALFAGCQSPDKSIPVINKIKADTEAIVKPLEGKKITKVRISDYSIDFVTDDGTLVTIYSYHVNPNSASVQDGGRLGAR